MKYVSHAITLGHHQGGGQRQGTAETIEDYKVTFDSKCSCTKERIVVLLSQQTEVVWIREAC